MRKLLLAVSALSLLAGPAPSFAAAHQCRNKAGKFVKCPMVKATAKPKVCRDAKGHYAKCK